jgi:FMN phosphatase YigB (HAD superfamily)
MTLQRLSFAERVPDAVLSYEVGEHKPHAAMFETMERQFCNGGVPLLYADDLEINVRAARERGWTAHLFESSEALLAEFEQCLGTLR